MPLSPSIIKQNLIVLVRGVGFHASMKPSPYLTVTFPMTEALSKSNVWQCRARQEFSSCRLIAHTRKKTGDQVGQRRVMLGPNVCKWRIVQKTSNNVTMEISPRQKGKRALSISSQYKDAMNKANQLSLIISWCFHDHSKSDFNPLYGALNHPLTSSQLHFPYISSFGIYWSY